jgi:Skp family chaperone for outer membrane proteins
MTIGLTVVAAGPALAQVARPTPTPAAQTRPTPPPVAANVPVPASKIALIDTTMFGDEKNGIYRYVDATKAVQISYRPQTNELQDLENRLNTLANEIDALMKATPRNQQVIDAKQQQGATLEAEYKTKKDKYDADLSKRYDEVVSPISKQIGAELDQFAARRGITLTLDISKIMPAILTAVPATDLTQTFINEFNAKYPRTTPPPTTAPARRP